MKRIIYILMLAASAMMLLASCHEDPTTPDVKFVKRAVLVYAVASNNLSTDFYDDRDEMLRGLGEVDLDQYDWYVYSVLPTSQAVPTSLQRITRDNTGRPCFEEIKTYDNSVASTHPRRIKEVISDFLMMSKAQNYGLVFWSHASAWLFSGLRHDYNLFPDIRGNEENAPSTPVAYSFGIDENGMTRDAIDVDELADCVPSGVFDFIWFDCCYMSNIESIYQFRDKCHYYIGYCMEIGAAGAPYDKIAPYLLREKPDFTSAANATMNYYLTKDFPVTVTVTDMAKIGAVAEACRPAYDGFEIATTSGLQNYSRMQYKLYDFEQYTVAMAEKYGNDAAAEPFRKALAEAVVYAEISDKDFYNRPVDKDNFCGISCHGVRNTDSEMERFYRTLDWYKTVYPAKE